MTGPPARIALIHALDESIAPAHRAFADDWPEAYCFDVSDTSLSADRLCGEVPEEIVAERICSLAAYAAASEGQGGKTAGILFTCSAFGAAIEKARDRSAIPVLKPNEAAFRHALAAGGKIGLLVTFPPSLSSLEAELREMARSLGKAIELRCACADGALDALRKGDAELHDRLAACAAQSLGDVDAIVLGQFSLARARTRVAEATEKPIITTPGSAVEALKGDVSRMATRLRSAHQGPDQR